MSAMTGSRPARSGRGARKELQIINRRAGALRHAGHGRGLREVIFRLGDLDEPIGEHSAALPAQRRNRQFDRSLSISVLRSTVRSAGDCARFAAAKRRSPRLDPATSRSQRDGL